MKLYRVNYEHRHPIWCQVKADDPDDAIARVKRGEFIEGTVDSDPGRDLFKNADAEEVL